MRRPADLLFFVLALVGSAAAARPKGQDGFSFGGYVHVQWMYDFRSGAFPRHGFELRRGRVEFCYDLDRAAVEIEIGCDELDLTLKDAFIRHQVAAPLALVAGLRKMPFSHEELTPASRLLTIERSEMNNAFGDVGYLGRDIGLAVEGELFHRLMPVGYSLGVFNGNGTKRAGDWNDAKQFCERLTFSPWSRLVLGVNASQRNDSLTGKKMLAWGGDLASRTGCATVEAEVLLGQAEPDTKMLGWYVQGFYRLGAFEPGLKFEQLYPDPGDRFDQTTAVTTACNWHLRRRLELKVNLVSKLEPAEEAGHKVMVQAQAGF